MNLWSSKKTIHSSVGLPIPATQIKTLFNTRFQHFWLKMKSRIHKNQRQKEHKDNFQNFNANASTQKQKEQSCEILEPNQREEYPPTHYVTIYKTTHVY